MPNPCCRAVGCSTDLSALPRLIFCARHEALIPNDVRRLPNDPGIPWIIRTAAAIEAIAAAEGKPVERVPLVDFARRLLARDRDDAAAAAEPDARRAGAAA
jgi:hypothetical protein